MLMSIGRRSNKLDIKNWSSKLVKISNYKDGYWEKRSLYKNLTWQQYIGYYFLRIKFAIEIENNRSISIMCEWIAF